MNYQKKSHFNGLMNLKTKHYSLDAPFNEDDESTLLNTLSDKNIPNTDHNLVYHESLKMEICEKLKRLPKRESEIIKMSYGIGYEYPITLEDIGKKYGVTKEMIRQLKRSAINKLKKAHSLKEYWD